MKLSQRRIAEQVGINMTPMIDIVFLLIIFFMTVSQLNQNVLSSTQLPVSEAGDDGGAPASLVLNIDSQGQFLVNDKVIPRNELDSFLQQAMERLKMRNLTPRVKLRCAANCSTTEVNFVFDRLSESGFETVIVAVRKQ